MAKWHRLGSTLTSALLQVAPQLNLNSVAHRGGALAETHRKAFTQSLTVLNPRGTKARLVTRNS